MADGEKIYDVAVLGAGPAGMTASMYCSRAGLSCAMVEMLSPGGQMAQTEHLENYPGFAESNSGFELAEIMNKQTESFGTETVYDEVVGVELEDKVKTIKLAYGELKSKSVIIATGARPAKLGIEGEDRLVGSGISYCATCDGNFFRGKDVCIVGGGDTAAADAIYLSRICNKVFMIVRRDVLRATAIYNNKLKEIENVEIIWNTTIDSIIEEDEMVAGVKIKNKLSGETKDLPVSAIFVAVGTVPNVEFLGAVLERDRYGHVVANEMGKTAIPGVFAAGDVRAKRLYQVTTAVGDGANAAEEAAEYLMTC